VRLHRDVSVARFSCCLLHASRCPATRRRVHAGLWQHVHHGLMSQLCCTRAQVLGSPDVPRGPVSCVAPAIEVDLSHQRALQGVMIEGVRGPAACWRVGWFSSAAHPPMSMSRLTTALQKLWWPACARAVGKARFNSCRSAGDETHLSCSPTAPCCRSIRSFLRLQPRGRSQLCRRCTGRSCLRRC
jgi:hypothetical protein